MPKTLVFHDTFLMKWGAERMNIEIAKILEADIATVIWSKNSYDARTMWFSHEIFETYPNFKKWMIGFLLMKASFFFSTSFPGKLKKRIQSYDTIFFSNEAISAIWWASPWVKTFYYAHSLPRHLFDQYELYLSKVPPLFRWIYKIGAWFFKKIYTKELAKVGKIFVNSYTNQLILKNFLERDSIVLLPPVDTQIFAYMEKYSLLPIFAIEWIELSYKDYYISFSRLTHAKRIDVIIEAFKKMPDKKLIILYGKNDSQREEFMKLGEWYENIVFRALSENEHLPYIINGAIASIAISKNEDFGMVAVESMACGVPVIAVDEGGYKETIVDGKTGILIPSDWLVENLTQIITLLTPEILESMKDACISRASDFSLEKFREKLLTYFQ